MKKLLFLALAACSLTVVSCKKNSTEETITIPQTQKALVVYKGATWCGPCGAYGKPVLRAMEAVGSDKVVCLASQTSDGLDCAASDAMGGALMTRYKQNGIPHMFVGGAGSWTDFYPDQTKATNTCNTLNANSAGCIANAWGKATYGPTGITVDTKTKFFIAGSGTYKLAAYICEDGIRKTQNGSSNDLHDNVIRGALGDALGTALSGSEAGQTYDLQLKGVFPTGVIPANCHITLVIFKMNGADFEAVNATELPLVKVD